MLTTVKEKIREIPEDAWTGIEYPQAIFDESSRTWISKAEVAEIPFTAFSSKKEAEQVTGRLIVRRVPELNETKRARGQDPLFDTYRHHGFFTTIAPGVLGTVAADKTHRGHAVIEQINAELKAGPLAHMPSGNFHANAAWLTIAAMAHNLLRTTAVPVGPLDAPGRRACVRRSSSSPPESPTGHGRSSCTCPPNGNGAKSSPSSMTR